MSINEVIKAAVSPIVPICKYRGYQGKETEYTFFNYVEIPEVIGDGMPEVIRYLVQLHYCCPASNRNPLATKRRLRQALLQAGFTAPTITDASDQDGQHYVYEFEWAGGDI